MNVTREEIDKLFPPTYGGNAQISDLRLMLTHLVDKNELGGIDFNEVPDIPARDNLDASEGDLCKVQDSGSGDPQTYIYDGNQWQILVDNSGGGAISIDDLDDVDTSSTTPNNNQTLKWDGTNWVPAPDENTDTTYSAGTGLALSGTTFSLNSPIGGLIDVDTTTILPTNGQLLKFNGTNWVPAQDEGTTYTAGNGLQLTGTEFSLNANINNLNDVDPSGVAIGQVLKWSGTQWLPANDDSGSGSSLTKITENFEVNSIDQQNQYLDLLHIPDTSDHLFVFLNGVYMMIGNNFDYVLSSNRIEFQGGILTDGDHVSVKYSY
jgi:hypothetical protein